MFWNSAIPVKRSSGFLLVDQQAGLED